MSDGDSPGGGATQAPKAANRCPTCGAPAGRRFRPFCSKRCQDVDLGRWLRGAYCIPTEEAPRDGGPGGTPNDDDSPLDGGG